MTEEIQVRRATDINKVAFVVIILFITGVISWAGITILHCKTQQTIIQSQIKELKLTIELVNKRLEEQKRNVLSKWKEHEKSTREIDALSRENLLFRIKRIELDVKDIKKILNLYVSGGQK